MNITHKDRRLRITMNIVMLTWSLCIFMHLHAADRNAITYNAARSLPPLAQPLPSYPWDQSTTERFVEHYSPTCYGQCTSLALPIPNDIPSTYALSAYNVLTRMYNHGCTMTSCCQCAFCFSSGSLLTELGFVCCSQGPLSMTVSYALPFVLAASAGTCIVTGLKSMSGSQSWTYEFDRDYLRTVIGFYNMQVQRAQERQPLLAAPTALVMDEFRDAIDDQGKDMKANI